MEDFNYLWTELGLLDPIIIEGDPHLKDGLIFSITADQFQDLANQYRSFE